MPAAEPIVESVFIRAEPHAVFRHFIEADALVRWMGEYAVVDPRPGGEFTVDIGGVPVRGEFVALEPPHRLALTWGHAGSDTLPPGASRVEVEIARERDGSVVRIVHSGLPAPDRAGFEVGWRHYGERLAITAAGGDAGPDPGM